MRHRVLLVVVLLLFAAGFAQGATYNVTNPGDTNANGSLRWAINQANANAGADTITFSLSSPYTIQPTGELPAVLGNSTTVDGNSQSGYSGAPLVCIDGRTNFNYGLHVIASNCLIRGLLVTRCNDAAIRLRGEKHRVEGCYVMSNKTAGIRIFMSPNNWVGGTNFATRNVCSSNGQYGIYVSEEGTTNNRIFGNYIGTDPTGRRAQSNLYSGIFFYTCSNNIVGGTNSWERNLISGNHDGVDVYYTSGGVTIQGNFIGTDVTGTNPLPNEGIGVTIGGANNVVGGKDAAARNIISGNKYYGVSLWYDTATGNVIRGNYIGVDTSGVRQCANQNHGIQVANFANNNTIGGTAAGEGNVISGNRENGILISQGAHHNTLYGNLIGLNAAGTAAISNRVWGVRIQGPSNTVGGLAAGTRNVVSGNGAAGIWADSTNACRTLIYGNYVGTDITGSNAVPNDSYGIEVSDAANCQIGTSGGGGNLVSGNSNAVGILVSAEVPTATGNVIRCNYVGTDASGRFAIPNYVGISVDCPGTVVGGSVAYRNIIAGNKGNGLSLASGTVVKANFIGVDATGLAALSNGTSGVDIWQGSYNQVGGTTPGDGNIISGNGGAGIRIYHSNSFNNVIEGNYIGTDVNGAFALGNDIGVFIDGGRSNRVGGSNPLSVNLISGNQSSGIELRSGARNNMIQRNLIGTDAFAVDPVSNANYGVLVNGSPDNWIGGRTNEGNIIAGNRWDGIGITGADSAGNHVFGNWIGCSATLAPLSNGEHGISVNNDALSNEIGSIVSGSVTNYIAFNGHDGVRVAGGTGNRIVQNLIFSNGWIGINLGADSYTTNDPDDEDSGANNMQNFPVLLSATNNGTQITVIGTIDGAQTSVKLIGYFGSSDVDPSGYGEGESVISTTNLVMIGPAGITTFTNRFPTPARPPSFITATATDGVTFDTSEFSYRLVLDSDHDGMPDGYEYDHFGGYKLGDPDEDEDGDKSSNLAEFMAGTDPGDPSSNLRFTEICLSGDDKAITFESSATRRYDAGRSQSVLGEGGWATLLYKRAGTGGAITFTDEWDYAESYYRMVPTVP